MTLPEISGDFLLLCWTVLTALATFALRSLDGRVKGAVGAALKEHEDSEQQNFSVIERQLNHFKTKLEVLEETHERFEKRLTSVDQHVSVISGYLEKMAEGNGTKEIQWEGLERRKPL